MKTFTFELEDKNMCNWCENKAIASAVLKLGNVHHEFHLCKAHLEEFKHDVDEGYEKIQEYIKFEEEQAKILENKKQELFNN